jgi:hypothetical protein
VPSAALESAAVKAESAVASEALATTKLPAHTADLIDDSAKTAGNVAREVANSASHSAKAIQFAESHVPTAIGVFQSAGQSYDGAKSVQAVEIAKKEFGSRNVSDREFEARVQAIKRGEGIDPAVKEQMERKAILTAALSASVGGVEGFMVGRLVRAVRDGTPIDSLPQSLFNDVRQELKLGNASGAIAASGRLLKHTGKEAAIGVATGAGLGTAMSATEEAAMAVAGVKSGRQAVHDFLENAPSSAGQSALLFGTGQVLQIRLRTERGMETARSKADARHITYRAFDENVSNSSILTGFTREHLPMPGEIDIHASGDRKWATRGSGKLCSKTR